LHPKFTARIEGSPEFIFDLIADMPNYGRQRGYENRRANSPIGRTASVLVGMGRPTPAGLLLLASTGRPKQGRTPRADQQAEGKNESPDTLHHGL
jgi:hypothetical protein